jgi:hypothetical protein
VKAALHAIVPGRVNPTWKWGITLLLIVKYNTAISMEQEAVRQDCACGTRSSAGLTVFTAFHHSRFSPHIFRTRKVGVEGYKLEEAAHS